MPDPNAQAPVAAPAAAPVAAPAASPAAAPAPATPDASAPAAAPAAPLTFPTAADAALTPPLEQAIVYEKTGDASLDVALQYVGERGFGPDHPAMKAAKSGDFAALEQALKGLGDKAKGHEAFVALAKDSFKRTADATKQAADKTASDVHAAVGGQEQWNAIQAWASANADDGEKQQLNAAFATGGIAAIGAAKLLAEGYAKRTGTGAKPVVKPDAPRTPPGAGDGPLGPREYAAAVQALRGTMRGGIDGTPEYAALQRRFRA